MRRRPLLTYAVPGALFVSAAAMADCREQVDEFQQQLYQLQQSDQGALPQTALTQVHRDIEEALTQAGRGEEQACLTLIGEALEQVRQFATIDFEVEGLETAQAQTGTDQQAERGEVAAAQGAQREQKEGEDRSTIDVVAPPAEIQVQQKPADVTVKQQPAEVAVDMGQPQVQVTREKPEVSVEQRPPKVTVKQQEPEASITMHKPQVDVQSREPQVQVEQTKPEVDVRQPEPQVSVRQPEPEVQVNQPEPEVSVNQPQPRIDVDQPPPEVEVTQTEADAQVQTARPDVQVRRAQPEVQVRTEDEEQRARARQGIEQDEETAVGADIAALEQERTMPRDVGSLEGFALRTAAGEELGDIERVMVDTKGTHYAVVSTGEVLGLGGREVLVPIDRLSFAGEETLVFRGDAEMLEPFQDDAGFEEAEDETPIDLDSEI